MEWSTGVAPTIARARAGSTPLLVLVEPATRAQSGGEGATETAAALHDRLATRALHEKLFVHAAVLAAIRESQTCCLRFCADEDNADFKAFSSFFSLTARTPNLFLIAPASGLVLYRLAGYVSPNAFLRALRNAALAVSNKRLDIPAEAAAAPPPPPVATAAGATEPTKPAAPTRAPAPAPASKPASKPAPAPAQPATTTAQTPSASRALKLPGGAPTRAHLRARLPDGANVARDFAATAAFSTVRAWAADAAGAPPGDVVIATAFPQRRVFDGAVDAESVDSLGLVPSANLVVSRARAAPSQGRLAGFGLGALGLTSGLSLRGNADAAAGTPPPQRPPIAQRAGGVAVAAGGPAGGGGGTAGGAGWQLPGVVSTASTAASVMGAFIRSFVAPGPGEQEAGATDAAGAGTGAGTGAGGAAGGAARPAARQQQTLGRGDGEGQALQMTTARRRGEQDREREAGSGENLMSNGNSTQFGWNDADFDDDGAGDGQTSPPR